MRLPLGLALAGLVLVTGSLVAWAGDRPTVEIQMRYSRFVPDNLELRAGQTVTFVLHNADPIDHEFILGDQAVQDLHAIGDEPYHDQIPTEVTVPAGRTVTTTIHFPEPGELIIGCHLPGHYDYGMKASLTVR